MNDVARAGGAGRRQAGRAEHDRATSGKAQAYEARRQALQDKEAEIMGRLTRPCTDGMGKATQVSTWRRWGVKHKPKTEGLSQAGCQAACGVKAPQAAAKATEMVLKRLRRWS